MPSAEGSWPWLWSRCLHAVCTKWLQSWRRKLVALTQDNSKGPSRSRVLCGLSAVLRTARQLTFCLCPPRFLPKSVPWWTSPCFYLRLQDPPAIKTINTCSSWIMEGGAIRPQETWIPPWFFIYVPLKSWEPLSLSSLDYRNTNTKTSELSCIICKDLSSWYMLEIKIYLYYGVNDC